jgi:hypothetical protein
MKLSIKLPICALAFSALAGLAQAQTQKPNVVLILAGNPGEQVNFIEKFQKK